MNRFYGIKLDELKIEKNYAYEASCFFKVRKRIIMIEEKSTLKNDI